MKSASRIRVMTAALALGFVSALSIAGSEMLIGDGLPAQDDLGLPDYRDGAGPPSWQGRPYAIPDESASTRESAPRAPD
jgi:hypothetical protein